MKINKLSIIACFFVIILATNIYALEIDNRKENIRDYSKGLILGGKSIKYNDLWEKYPPIEIKNAFGIPLLERTLFRGVIKNHTEKCHSNCQSKISLEHDGGILIQDIRFKRTFNNGIKWHDWNSFTNYELYVNNKSYSVGEKLEKGTYELIIKGKKKNSTVLDWQIKTQGKWLTEWAIWDSTLKSYYSLDYASGNVRDSTGNTNGTNYGATRNLPGKINNSFNFSNDYVDINTTILDYGQLTINLWMATNTTTRGGLIGNDKAGKNDDLILEVDGTGAYCDAGEVLFSRQDSTTASNNDICSNGVVNDGSWHMITALLNTSGMFLYVDNVAQTNYSTFYEASTNQSGFSLGTNGLALMNRNYTGQIDEVGIWNNPLSSSEINSLWNSGAGTGFQGEFNLILNAPIDNYMSDNESVIFNYTVIIGDSDLVNVSLINVSDFSILGTNYYSPTAGELFSSGSAPQITTGTTFIWVKNLTTDDLFISRTQDILNPESSSKMYRMFNFIYSDGTNATSGIDSQTGSSGVHSQDNPFPERRVSVIETYIRKDVEDGLYARVQNNKAYGYLKNNDTATINLNITSNLNWTFKACDTDGDCEYAGENRSLEIDNQKPEIVIESPTNMMDYNYLGNNETLNVTFTDPNLESCWYNYNGTNISLACVSGVKLSENFILEDKTNLTIYANDSIGNINITFLDWEYKLLELSQSYNIETNEGALEDFEALVRVGTGLTVTSGTINYNGTSSIGNSVVVGENNQITKEDLLIPEVSSEVNVTFNWIVVLSDATVINLSSQEQQVNNLNIDNCSLYTNQILTLNMVDEEEQTALTNTNIEIALNLYSEDRSNIVVSLAGNFENENPLGICLSENITGEIIYSLDAIILYTAEEYAIEYYNLVGVELTNSSSNENLTLYSLNATDSTEFQLTFKGEDALPVEDALIFVERQYISEDSFKTVELPKTDANGQTVLHLVRNDVIYNIRVIKNNILLGEFANIIAFCEDFTIGSCSLNLNALSNSSLIFNYDEEVGIIYNSPPQYNQSSNQVYFSFSSSDGNAKTVEINVERSDVFGNRTICTNSVVSSGGTLVCNLGSNLTDTLVISTISVDEKEWLNSYVVVDDTAYGQTGYVLFFLMSIGITLMFSKSKTGVLIGMSLNWIFGISLGLVVGGITGIGSAGIWILVISMIGIWKLNNRRRE